MRSTARIVRLADVDGGMKYPKVSGNGNSFWMRHLICEKLKMFLPDHELEVVHRLKILIRYNHSDWNRQRVWALQRSNYLFVFDDLDRYHNWVLLCTLSSLIGSHYCMCSSYPSLHCKWLRNHWIYDSSPLIHIARKYTWEYKFLCWMHNSSLEGDRFTR